MIWQRRAAWILAVVVTLAFFTWVKMSEIALMGECDLTQHAALPSPDGSKQVLMFDVNCGATTGFNTQIAIGPSNVEFDRDATPPALVMDGRWSLPVRWIDERTLFIRIPKNERYYRKLTAAGDVTIVYDEEAR